MATIKQKSVIVDVEGGKRIEVRRMRNKPMRDFSRKFAEVLTGALRGAPAEITIGRILIDKAAEIIAGADELITLLCTQSTDLSLDEFDNLDSLAASAVLDAALAVNFDDEIKNSWAGIGAKIAALMPAKHSGTTKS
jgi:hypothetical protein